MAKDEIGPVPTSALLAGANPDDVPSATIWLNNVLAINQRTNSTDQEGKSLQMTNIDQLSQSISNPPTQAEVAAIQTKVNEIIVGLINSLKMEG